MNIPIPDFVPVFSAETIQLVSIILLIAGVCAVAVGAILLKKSRKEKRTLEWILICAGVMLIADHGLQLIF